MSKITAIDIVGFADTSISTPTDGVRVGAASIAERSMLASVDSGGHLTPTQPSFWGKKVGRWAPVGATTILSDGIATATVQGTITTRDPTAVNFGRSLRRVGAVSAAGAGNSAGWGPAGATNQFWRGSLAGTGGWFKSFRFMISDAVIVDATLFVGLFPAAVIAGAAQPSTLVNCLGVGCNTGDTTLRLYASGAVAQPRIDLGADFPVNTTNVDVYELITQCAPNGADIKYTVNRLNTGHTVSGTISAAASLFANNVFVSPKVHRSNAAIAAAVGIDLVNLYIETDD